MKRIIENESLYHFPGDEELLEKIASVEKYSSKEREAFNETVKQFIKKAEENAFQLLDYFTTHEKITLDDLYKMSFEEQQDFVMSHVDQKNDLVKK
jgi:vacuolar-type H+-ATPase subunit H